MTSGNDAGLGHQRNSPNGETRSSWRNSKAEQSVNLQKLDLVTHGAVRDMYHVCFYGVDRPLKDIAALPTRDERLQMTVALGERMHSYGVQRGWLDKSEHKNDNRAFSYANFVVKMLGVSGDAVDQKIVDDFHEKLVDWIRTALNKRGKATLDMLDCIYKIAKADTPEERLAELAKGVGPVFGNWIAANWLTLLKAGLKMTTMNHAERYAVARVCRLFLEGWIGAAVAWLGSWAERLDPWLLAIDLILTPTEIDADDKVGFLEAYKQVMDAARDFAGGRLAPSVRHYRDGALSG